MNEPLGYSQYGWRPRTKSNGIEVVLRNGNIGPDFSL